MKILKNLGYSIAYKVAKRLTAAGLKRNKPKTAKKWRPQGESNPCCRDENPES